MLVDSAVVGTLGTTPLAGLGLASTVLTTVVGPVRLPRLRDHRRGRAADRRRSARRGAALRRRRAVARRRPRRGARRRRSSSARRGWRARSGAGRRWSGRPSTYLRWSAPGPARDARGARRDRRAARHARHPHAAVGRRRAGPCSTPCSRWRSCSALGMGVAGSGLGTAVTQLLMAAVLGGWWCAAARREGVPLRPGRARDSARAIAAGGRCWPGPRRCGRRSCCHLGGRRAGRGRARRAPGGRRAVGARGVRASTRWRSRRRRWWASRSAPATSRPRAGCCAGRSPGAWPRGAVLGAVSLAACAGCRAAVHRRPRGARRDRAGPARGRASTLPMAGWVFVLDGVLIGAGDGRYLARRRRCVTLRGLRPGGRARCTPGPAGGAGPGVGLGGVRRGVHAGAGRTTGWRAPAAPPGSGTDARSARPGTVTEGPPRAGRPWAPTARHPEGCRAVVLVGAGRRLRPAGTTRTSICAETSACRRTCTL